MRRYGWTGEELARLRKLRADGLSQPAIGEVLGRSKGATLPGADARVVLARDLAPGAVARVTHNAPSHALGMFVVTEAEAAAIRAAFERRGELSAVVELPRLFPGGTDNAQARECVRTIAGWKPLPLRTVKRAPRLRRVR
jgi:hypothetical protein